MKMHNVFISYSTRETGKAEAVRNILEKNGIVCWMAPRDIPAGSNYTEEIPAAIRGCQVFLLILSQNAQKSTWVPRELETAVNCGKVIIPFMVEDFQLNDEFNFLLGAKHRYAAYQNNAEIMKVLVERIRAIIGEKPWAAEIVKQPHQEMQVNEEKRTAETVHTVEKKQVQWSEQISEPSMVEVSEEMTHCPICGKKLKQIVKPYRGEDEKKAATKCIVLWCIPVLLLSIILMSAAGIGFGVLIGGIWAAIDMADAKVIELRQKKGIYPFTALKCKKCKKQYVRKAV